MNSFVYLLGFEDPEMVVIEKLLKEQGLPVLYATHQGQRVLPRTAYQADPIEDKLEQIAIGRGFFSVPADLVCIECAIPGCVPAVVIDHHRPNDPGYGMPPEKYLEASSIGQLWQHLGLFLPMMPLELRVVAACDHCLGAAWEGLCPGVSSEAVRDYRARLAPTRPGREKSEEQYRKDFDIALGKLNRAPFISISSVPRCYCFRVVDLRDQLVEELPDAASYAGHAYVTTVADRDGRKKIVLGGNTTPDMVHCFIEGWAPAQGLTEIYGSPERGFAGGYLPVKNQTE